MKYNVTTKFNMQVLTIKLQKNENIVENEVLWINSQRIPNLIPVQVNNNAKESLLNFNVNGFMSLKNYFKKKMIRSEVTVLLRSIVECCKSIETNRLVFEKLLLDDKGIFINPVSKKCEFVYVPIDIYTNGTQKGNFLNKVIRNIHLEKKENTDFIINFKNIISNPQFTWNMLDDFVKGMADEDRKIFNMNKNFQDNPMGFNKSNGGAYSQGMPVGGNVKFCTKCGQKYAVGSKFCTKCGTPISAMTNPVSASPMQNNSVQNNPAQPIQGEGAHIQTQVSPEPPFSAQAQIKPPPPSPQPVGNSKPPTPPMPPQQNMQGKPPIFNQQRPPQPQKSYELTPPRYVYDDESEAATSVLNQYFDEADEATSVLSANKTPRVIYPYFVRERNGEEIHVNKDSFNIGKGRSSDYVIAGNNAISRNHATIVTKDGKYFIIDNQSTNFTYINGVKILANEENEIKASDVIKLADEEFTMYIDK